MNIQELQRENIKRLKPYSSARDEFKGSVGTFLDANENPHENGINRYPDPQQRDLKRVLSEKKNISADQIFIGNGSDEGIDLILRSFCEPKKDNIVGFNPSYGMYQVLADIHDIEIRYSNLDTEFQPNFEDLMSKIDENTKAVFICSPNNPTGNTFDEKLILEVVKQDRFLVYIDEAYIDFASTEGFLKYLPKYNNLIVSQTMSKSQGMAAIRLGVVYANREVISILNKVKMPYNISQLVQDEFLERIEDGHYISTIKEIMAERNELIKALQSFDIVEKIFTSEANFLLVRFSESQKVFQHLQNSGIVVRDRSRVHNGNGCLRISVGTAPQNKQLIDTLSEVSKN